jgi:hypothetical protein
MLWGVQAFIAFVVVLPLAGAFAELQASGFDQMMARQADVTLLAELNPETREALRGILLNLLWAIPLVGIIRAVAAVGIINAVRDGGLRSFWSGVGQFGGRSIVIAVAYLVLAIAVHSAVQVPLILALGQSGEKASMLMGLIAWPIVVVVVSAITDCMQDYSQIELVARGKGVVKSIGDGLAWPFRHPSVLALYALWMVIAIAITVSPLVLENMLPAATAAGVLLLLVLQQFMMIVRAGVTVAWYGSEVSYFEANAAAELPLIAD